MLLFFAAGPYAPRHARCHAICHYAAQEYVTLFYAEMPPHMLPALLRDACQKSLMFFFSATLLLRDMLR